MVEDRYRRPTLEDCEEAVDFLEDLDNYDDGDEPRPGTLKVRVRDYPEGSGRYFLVLTWHGLKKPSAGQIPVPPGWRLDGEWFFTEIARKQVILSVWQVGLIYEGWAS